MSFQCRALSLLNKLADPNFANISQQIITLINTSASENDGDTLRIFMELCVDTAVAQPKFSAVYARLCSAVSSHLASEMHADGFHDEEGKPMVGGRLFRTMLLRRVQDGFERIMSSFESESYLGLVRFVGEIFKVQLLTERVVHECIEMLLGIESPFAVNIEAACLLLDIGGSSLDTPNAGAHMDAHFSRLRQSALDANTPLRIGFMIQDLCDRRSQNWPHLRSKHCDDIVAMPLDPDPAGEPYINDAILSEKINHIFRFGVESSDAERGLACLHPDYVPTLVKLLVQHVISTKHDRITALASRFLHTVSAKDLLLTSVAHLGITVALDECQLESDSVPHLISILDAVGMDTKRRDLLMEGALRRGADHPPGEEDGEDSEHIYVNSAETAAILEKISTALSLPILTISPTRRLKLTVFSDWLSRIEELDAQFIHQQSQMRDMQSTVESMSSQLSKGLENMRKAQQERDVMEMARNSERMRRMELQERLTALQAEAQNLEKDLRQARGRVTEVEAELQRAKNNEKTQKTADAAARKVAREEGRDSMLAEMIQLLSSKRDHEQQTRQAEKRKAERILGAERERARCMKRDETFTKTRFWTPSLAFQRFETILLFEEFVKFRFCDSSPLTFEALPWPILAKPGTFSAQSITADTVRKFFRAPAITAARSAAYPVPADYRKYLLKQSLLAFHEDKMVARIATVDDDALRQQIAEAARIVTQTLNELMQHIG